MLQTISRSGNFDSGHRVMNERMKCFNLHGHTYLYDLQFSFSHIESIGYAIDFKEIKRIGCQWIDDILDHGYLANPHDKELITIVKNNQWKLWEMSLNGDGNYCNPTVENVAKEIFLAMEILFQDIKGLGISTITLNETPKCKTTCSAFSISADERKNFYSKNQVIIKQYTTEKGVIIYDDRKA